MKYVDDYKHLGKKTYDYTDYVDKYNRQLRKKVLKSIKKFDSHLFHSIYQDTRREIISILRSYFINKEIFTYNQMRSVSNFKENQTPGFCKYLKSHDDKYIDIKKYRILKIEYFENQ